MVPDLVSEAPLTEFPVHGHEDCTALVRVHGEIVVLTLSRESGLTGSPAFVALVSEHRADANWNVVI